MTERDDGNDGLLESYLAAMDNCLEEKESLQVALDEVGDYGDLRLMRADLAETRDCLREALAYWDEYVVEPGTDPSWVTQARRLLAYKYYVDGEKS